MQSILKTGTVPYIKHNTEHAYIPYPYTHTHNMHTVKHASHYHTYTYNNLCTLAELSFHKNWLSESPPCVFDSLYKGKCEKKKASKELLSTNFGTCLKHFSYGVVKTMLNVHKI